MKSKIFIAVGAFIWFTAILDSCQSEKELKYQHYFANGRRLYERHCQNCHADNGTGLGELYPPLSDTLLLKESRPKLAKIIKFGLKGRITVSGKQYDGEMPGEPGLAPIDIAALVTYVSNSFGNKQGSYDVADAEKDLAR